MASVNFRELQQFTPQIVNTLNALGKRLLMAARPLDHGFGIEYRKFRWHASGP